MIAAGTAELASGPFLVEVIRPDGKRRPWGWYETSKEAATVAARLCLHGIAAEVADTRAIDGTAGAAPGSERVA